MVVAFYFRLHLAYFPRPVVAIFARPEHCARAVCRGSREAGTAAKNVGVEETNPRRPHFIVTGEYTEAGDESR